MLNQKIPMDLKLTTAQTKLQKLMPKNKLKTPRLLNRYSASCVEMVRHGAIARVVDCKSDQGVGQDASFSNKTDDSLSVGGSSIDHNEYPVERKHTAIFGGVEEEKKSSDCNS